MSDPRPTAGGTSGGQELKLLEDASLSPEDVILAGMIAGYVGVWRWERRTNQLYWSPNLEAIHQLPPGSYDGTFRVFENDIHPDDRAPVFAEIERVLSEGGHYRVEYRVAPKGVDEPIWLEARGQAIEHAGEIVGMTGVCQDITARRHHEVELRRRTRQQEAIARLGQLAITELGDSEQRLFDAAVAETAEALGVEMCKLLELTPGGNEFLLRSGIGWKPGIVGSARLGVESGTQAGYTLKARGAVVVTDLSSETRFSGPELLLDHGVVSGLSVLIAGEDGRDYGVLGAHSSQRQHFTRTDVDFLRSVANLLANAIHRNRAVERQELLVRELRHRVGNLLSLISSLFNNSASAAQSVPELEEKFLARLMSLARAHSMISQGGWQTTCLKGLVEAVLEPYSGRIETAGGDVGIGADSGVALSLAIHELATNATKYGALSASDGKVSVTWSVARRDNQPLLTIEWSETGGPEIRPPDSRGFGTKLMSAVIERQLGGTIAADYAPSGLKVRFDVPIG